MNLTTTAVGDLDHFTWVETPKPSGNHVQVNDKMIYVLSLDFLFNIVFTICKYNLKKS